MKEEKAALRAAMLARRTMLDPIARKSAAAEIGAILSKRLALGASVAGYHAIRGEVDPFAFLATRAGQGATIALPAIVSDRLVFRCWRPSDPLVVDRLGLSEPLPEAEAIVPDAVLVPLVAFDDRGHRLGYGGGYYDRTFDDPAFARCRRIGLAYAFQQVEALPDEPHDAMLDAVVTEAGYRSFGSRGET